MFKTQALKLVAAFGVLAFTLFAQAQQLELPLNNPGAAADVDKLLTSIETDRSWDVFGVANGSHDVFSFDASSFSEAKAKASIESGLENGTESGACQFETSSGAGVWRDLINLEEENGDRDAKGLTVLKALEATGQTLAIYGRSWDGASGDSEYCSKYDFDIYFKNGKQLSINYDITD